MALYEYECTLNGHRFEVRHGMNESPVYACLECAADVRRVITAPGIVFKGSGFYATDSRKPSEPVSKPTPPSAAGDSQPKTDPAPTAAPDGRKDTVAVS